MEKQIRVFNFSWHLAHQYDLFKIPNLKIDWLIQHRRGYAEMPRGQMIEKYGIEWVPHYEKGKYDFALLHLDQQCLDENLWERGKGSLYREVNEVIQDIPKIVIMHGTPYYPENFSCNITEDNYKQKGYTKDQIGMSSELIEKFKEALGDNYVVFNSYTAQKQWGFTNNQKARTIWHGLDPDEWYDLPKEPRVVTMISPGGLDKYYDRTFLRRVKEDLAEKDITHCHITVDANFKNWEEYRQFLGRSLVYFNPTRQSPMPRARTEAMMSGCCIVTTPSQDASDFIETGENGFIIRRNPTEVVNLIESLINDYRMAKTIGQEGKKIALKLFHKDRYVSEWNDLISKVLNKK